MEVYKHAKVQSADAMRSCGRKMAHSGGVCNRTEIPCDAVFEACPQVSPMRVLDWPGESIDWVYRRSSLSCVVEDGHWGPGPNSGGGGTKK